MSPSFPDLSKWFIALVPALKEYRAKRGVTILHFPTVLGADVPMYNIPEVTTELKFTPEALAGIFLDRRSRGT